MAPAKANRWPTDDPSLKKEVHLAGRLCWENGGLPKDACCTCKCSCKLSFPPKDPSSSTSRSLNAEDALLAPQVPQNTHLTGRWVLFTVSQTESWKGGGNRGHQETREALHGLAEAMVKPSFEGTCDRAARWCVAATRWNEPSVFAVFLQYSSSVVLPYWHELLDKVRGVAVAECPILVRRNGPLSPTALASCLMDRSVAVQAGMSPFPSSSHLTTTYHRFHMDEMPSNLCVCVCGHVLQKRRFTAAVERADDQDHDSPGHPEEEEEDEVEESMAATSTRRATYSGDTARYVLHSVIYAEAAPTGLGRRRKERAATLEVLRSTNPYFSWAVAVARPRTTLEYTVLVHYTRGVRVLATADVLDGHGMPQLPALRGHAGMLKLCQTLLRRPGAVEMGVRPIRFASIKVCKATMESGPQYRQSCSDHEDNGDDDDDEGEDKDDQDHEEEEEEEEEEEDVEEGKKNDDEEEEEEEEDDDEDDDDVADDDDDDAEEEKEETEEEDEYDDDDDAVAADHDEDEDEDEEEEDDDDDARDYDDEEAKEENEETEEEDDDDDARDDDDEEAKEENGETEDEEHDDDARDDDDEEAKEENEETEEEDDDDDDDDARDDDDEEAKEENDETEEEDVDEYGDDDEEQDHNDAWVTALEVLPIGSDSEGEDGKGKEKPSSSRTTQDSQKGKGKQSSSATTHKSKKAKCKPSSTATTKEYKKAKAQPTSSAKKQEYKTAPPSSARRIQESKNAKGKLTSSSATPTQEHKKAKVQQSSSSATTKTITTTTAAAAAAAAEAAEATKATTHQSKNQSQKAKSKQSSYLPNNDPCSTRTIHLSSKLCWERCGLPKNTLCSCRCSCTLLHPNKAAQLVGRSRSSSSSSSSTGSGEEYAAAEAATHQQGLNAEDCVFHYKPEEAHRKRSSTGRWVVFTVSLSSARALLGRAPCHQETRKALLELAQALVEPSRNGTYGKALWCVAATRWNEPSVCTLLLLSSSSNRKPTSAELMAHAPGLGLAVSQEPTFVKRLCPVTPNVVAACLLERSVAVQVGLCPFTDKQLPPAQHKRPAAVEEVSSSDSSCLCVCVCGHVLRTHRFSSPTSGLQGAQKEAPLHRNFEDSLAAQSTKTVVHPDDRSHYVLHDILYSQSARDGVGRTAERKSSMEVFRSSNANFTWAVAVDKRGTPWEYSVLVHYRYSVRILAALAAASLDTHGMPQLLSLQEKDQLLKLCQTLLSRPGAAELGLRPQRFVAVRKHSSPSSSSSSSSSLSLSSLSLSSSSSSSNTNVRMDWQAPKESGRGDVDVDERKSKEEEEEEEEQERDEDHNVKEEEQEEEEEEEEECLKSCPEESSKSGTTVKRRVHFKEGSSQSEVCEEDNSQSKQHEPSAKGKEPDGIRSKRVESRKVCGILKASVFRNEHIGESQSLEECHVESVRRRRPKKGKSLRQYTLCRETMKRRFDQQRRGHSQQSRNLHPINNPEELDPAMEKDGNVTRGQGQGQEQNKKDLDLDQDRDQHLEEPQHKALRLSLRLQIEQHQHQQQQRQHRRHKRPLEVELDQSDDEDKQQPSKKRQRVEDEDEHVEEDEVKQEQQEQQQRLCLEIELEQDEGDDEQQQQQQQRQQQQQHRRRKQDENQDENKHDEQQQDQDEQEQLPPVMMGIQPELDLYNEEEQQQLDEKRRVKHQEEQERQPPVRRRLENELYMSSEQQQQQQQQQSTVAPC